MTDALEDTLASAEQVDIEMADESEDVAAVADEQQQEQQSENGNEEPPPRLMITKMVR